MSKGNSAIGWGNSRFHHLRFCACGHYAQQSAGGLGGRGAARSGRQRSLSRGRVSSWRQGGAGGFKLLALVIGSVRERQLAGRSRSIFWRVGGPERSALDPWAWRRARVQFCVTACGQCVRIREGRHCFRRLACTLPHRRCQAVESDQTNYR